MKRILMLILLYSLFLHPTSAQAIQTEAAALDVVLISDTSGSMAYTDPQRLRVDAARLLLEILPAGSRIGGIVFSGAVHSAAPLALKQTSSVDNVVSLIADSSPTGYTNLGAALEHALSMVSGRENAALILLTDGSTELDSSDALAASLQARDRALAEAKAQGIPIYGVALNANGKGNVDEIVSMTQACVEVSCAEDLELAYSTLASLLQGGVRTPETVLLPYSGTFRIPSGGVCEVNLVVISPPDDMAISITRPDGTTLTPQELSSARIVTGHCTLIKLTQPLQTGLWRYSITSRNTVSVSTHLVYNSQFQIDLLTDPQIPFPDQSVTVTARLSDGTTSICDNAFSLTAQAVHADTGAIQPLSLLPNDNCYTALWTPEETGTYYLTVTACLLGGVASRTGQLTVSVEDRPPIPASETQSATRWSGPFSGDIRLDLSNWFTDPEGAPLTYQHTIPGAFLSGDELVLTADTPAGIYSVWALDGKNTPTYVQLQVKTRPTWFLILPAALVLTGLLLFLFLLWRSSGLAGCVTVELDGQRTVAGLSGHRMHLARLLRQAGLDPHRAAPSACFRATKNGPILDTGTGHVILLRPRQPAAIFLSDGAQLTLTLGGDLFDPSDTPHRDADWSFSPAPSFSDDNYAPNWD